MGVKKDSQNRKTIEEHKVQSKDKKVVRTRSKSNGGKKHSITKSIDATTANYATHQSKQINVSIVDDQKYQSSI